MRECLPGSRVVPPPAREDPRRWGERDYYEYWFDRAPRTPHAARFEHLSGAPHSLSAPDLIALVADAWDGID